VSVERNERLSVPVRADASCVCSTPSSLCCFGWSPGSAVFLVGCDASLLFVALTGSPAFGSRLFRRVARVAVGEATGSASKSRIALEGLGTDLVGLLTGRGEIVSNGSGDSRPSGSKREMPPEGPSRSPSARGVLAMPLPFTRGFPAVWKWEDEAMLSADELDMRRARRVAVHGRATFRERLDPTLMWGDLRSGVVVSRQSGELWRRRRPTSC
jgi:hypothetical protein